jgi:hypothetical protein
LARIGEISVKVFTGGMEDEEDFNLKLETGDQRPETDLMRDGPAGRPCLAVSSFFILPSSFWVSLPYPAGMSTPAGKEEVRMKNDEAGEGGGRKAESRPGWPPSDWRW